ncbi:MarR family winged helix-turn-helix transcriptional regulator [Tepidamorphus sp. 3E244]|uniref:MarR family winged helix-turn-helix transcriptional regulator n=1 Tax=Tepidamorphus sp. 3E244 TaxID=3385498 RepID=UPI0038FBFFCA
MRDDSDARFRELVHNLLAFSARLEAIRGRFGAHLGLTGIQYTILISVRHLEGEEGVGVKALAEHLGLSGAFVTIETGKLIKEDMLMKRPNPLDRRRVLLSVSHKGRTCLHKLAPVQREINDLIFEALDEERFDALCTEAAALRHNGERAIALADYLLSDTKGNADV